MAEDTPTPTGGETEHSVSSAAHAISLLGAEKPPEKPIESTSEEAPPTDSGETPERTEETKGTDAKTEDAQETTLETLDQLSEATGLPIESILNLRARTKVDGQETDVPLAEIVKSYQLSKHVNNESQELANRQKALEAERQSFESKQKELTDNLQRTLLLTNAEEQELQQAYSQIDWDTLRATDSTEYLLRQQDFAQRHQRLVGRAQWANQELQKAQENQRKEAETKAREFSQAQSVKLMNLIPDWKDETKRNSEQMELRNYLKSMDFTEGDIGSISDARLVKLIRNAYLYDKASRPSSLKDKKIANLKPVLKPGGPKLDDKSERIEKSMTKLRKSNNINDAVNVLSEMIK